ncbi:hypothetical protein [uncultured Nostoc sp.]|uniref:hypothetical protein n=1 Tax=uncultured Nostoc sp. TaxID=340711 RepID=UPI0035CB4108
MHWHNQSMHWHNQPMQWHCGLKDFQIKKYSTTSCGVGNTQEISNMYQVKNHIFRRGLAWLFPYSIVYLRPKDN